jgi:hypothetical protein
MDKSLYSIFDKVSGIYAPPFVELTDGTAIRACTDLLQRPELPFAKYPKDYRLVKVANWNEVDAHASPITNKTIIEFTTLTDATKKE